MSPSLLPGFQISLSEGGFVSKDNRRVYPANTLLSVERPLLYNSCLGPSVGICKSLDLALSSTVPSPCGAQDSSSSASNLKMQALLFLYTALDTAEAVSFQPSLPALAPPVLAAVGERYYKVGCLYLPADGRFVLARSEHVCSCLAALVAPADRCPSPGD